MCVVPMNKTKILPGIGREDFGQYPCEPPWSLANIKLLTA